MCGIAGWVDPGAANSHRAAVVAMCDRLSHRGPDGHGVWSDEHIVLGHRRLAVVDTSEAGLQPMTSADERWILSFNGEIYNAQALRRALDQSLQQRSLAAVSWRGESDTEVLLEHIARFGVADTLPRLVGMFAFAAYDRREQKLYLARDRLGIKPLYFGRFGSQTVFASELVALQGCGLPCTLNRDALASHLRYSYVPGPASIFNEVHKLLPGCWVEIDAVTGFAEEPQCWWQLADHMPAEGVFASMSAPEAEERLHHLLLQAVQDRLVADVPLGAFLSGGYDSSLVCALMCQASTVPVKTFSIGFHEAAWNEAQHAQAIAAHLGTQHTELYVSEQDMLAAVDQLPQLLDEPFADPSILPTWLLCQLTRQQVTVALSGDGGDELFWGYGRYATAKRLWSRLAGSPLGLRKVLAGMAGSSLLQAVAARIPSTAGGRRGTLQQKMQVASDLVGADNPFDFYHAQISHWRRPADVLVGGHDLLTPYNDLSHWTRKLPFEHAMAAQDVLSYLPDDILTKVDRASMGVSLEARVPLLDHRVVEFAAGLPGTLKAANGESKVLLRRVLARYVPRELTERPKMGFGVPLSQWLRGPLKSWCSDLLSPTTLQRDGVFQPHVVGALLGQHLSGKADNAAKLWDVLMVQVWLQKNKDVIGQ